MLLFFIPILDLISIKYKFLIIDFMIHFIYRLKINLIYLYIQSIIIFFKFQLNFHHKFIKKIWELNLILIDSFIVSQKFILFFDFHLYFIHLLQGFLD